MKVQNYWLQFYDNNDVMDTESGVCQRISDINNSAVFMKCNKRLLNLMGIHTAKWDTAMAIFVLHISKIFRNMPHSKKE